RSQFKAPYEKSLAQYTQKLERQRQEAREAEQQRLAQQQIDAQNRARQQQQAQRELQELANSFAQFGQQMQASGQQMMNSVVTPPTGQVNFGPRGGNSVNCVHAGPVTNCRY